MSERNIDTFAGRIQEEIISGMSCLTLYIGHRLGLFKALADAGPVTSDELAKQSGLNERYIQEWLECMAVNEYLHQDAETGRFSLPPEYAPALVDIDNPYYVAPLSSYIPWMSAPIKLILDAFRSSGGVPYEAYVEDEDIFDDVGMSTRGIYVNNYVHKWIPTMPDIKKRLESGARVADIGCGTGWSSIVLAKGFLNVHIDAVDADEKSIQQARANAHKEGVSGQIEFHHSTAEDMALKGPYVLVTSFICIHDMAYPVKALSRIREITAPDGAVLIGDMAVSDNLSENYNFWGRFCYNASVLHCLPQSMVFPGSAATGTLMGPGKLQQFASEAGFRKMEVLPIENPFWRFYRLTP
ncbi:methyltransferase domain-containing protein [Candidatus Poribacteria bacterium]|nr:methyltransferase domain-containing protein [Candidatus Poribacteria bacterium]